MCVSARLAFALSFALLQSACRSPDAGPGDGAAPPADLARLADDGPAPGDFCAGAAAKVDSRGGLIAPAAVTSSRLILNCCDGVMLRFHVEAVAGVRPSVMIRQLGGRISSGDLDLGKLPDGVEVGLWANDAPVTAKLGGAARLDVPAGQNEPIRVGLCVTVAAPGSPLDGARLYARDVPVMPWGWDGRFTMKLLADRTITAAQALKQPLAGLALAPDALMSVSSLSYYEKSAHRGYWDTWSNTELVRNRVGAVGTQGVPFVVEADGQRVYLGAFYSLISSQSFAGPTIVIEDLKPEGFTIEPSYPPNPQNPDPRADPRILKVFAENGKLLP